MSRLENQEFGQRMKSCDSFEKWLERVVIYSTLYFAIVVILVNNYLKSQDSSTRCLPESKMENDDIQFSVGIIIFNVSVDSIE